MTLLALRLFSFVLSIMPEWVHRALVAVFGDFTFFCLPRRRRIILSNLDHAFPERPREWQRRIGRQSCRQMIETGLISLILPHLSIRRIHRMLKLDPPAAEYLRQLFADPQPIVFVTPHLGGWELGACMRVLVPTAERALGCIYRPLDNPRLNEWVIQARSRFGIQMMSRRSGLADGMRVLRDGGAFFILFDQAGPATSELSILLNRLCLSTPLPGLMVDKFNARLVTYVMHRVSSFRYRIHAETLGVSGGAEQTTRLLDRWLGDLLTRDEKACGSWLWAHNRWKLRETEEQYFRLEHRRSGLLAAGSVPRTNRFFVRLPDELRAALWALPLIRALRASRPDANLTAVAHESLAVLVQSDSLFDGFVIRPSRGGEREFQRDLHHRFPDYWVSFDDSGATDVEAKGAHCPERFGIQRGEARRTKLNHLWRVPSDLDESLEHRAHVLARYFRHFGLEGEIDWRPVLSGIDPISPDTNRVLLGSRDASDMSTDHWPAECWARLVDRMTSQDGRPNLWLRGLRHDAPGTTTIQEENSWKTLASHLVSCRLVITDDLDLLHLAGALGVPVVALLGAANPRREGPVFSAPAWVVQPPDCPETGGVTLQALKPETVFERAMTAWSVVAER